MSREQAEEVRLAVESRLQGTGRVRLAAAADVVRVKALREGTTGLSGPEAEAQIRAAFAGDASVFLVEPRRAGESAAFRLQAITRSASCKATSEPLTVPIRVGAGVADVDAEMERAVKAFGQAAPTVAAVEVCPFEPRAATRPAPVRSPTACSSPSTRRRARPTTSSRARVSRCAAARPAPPAPGR